MPKKRVEKDEEENEEEIEVDEEEEKEVEDIAMANPTSTTGIAELSLDFQRADLNLLRDKVNELIRAIN